MKTFHVKVRIFSKLAQMERKCRSNDWNTFRKAEMTSRK